MFKGRFVILSVICLLLLAAPSPVLADRPEGKGKGKTPWDLGVEAMNTEAQYYGTDIYGIAIWGAPFMLTLTPPNPHGFSGFTLVAVDVYKDGVIHHEITPLQQTDPQKYTIFIQESGCPVDTLITYSIVARVPGKTFSEDVTISYLLCQP